jgi:hypothetical protein
VKNHFFIATKTGRKNQTIYNLLQAIALGVDIGGSHINAVAVDMQNHTIKGGSRSESSFDNKADADEILSVWAGTLRRCAYSSSHGPAE